MSKSQEEREELVAKLKHILLDPAGVPVDELDLLLTDVLDCVPLKKLKQISDNFVTNFTQQ